VTIMTKDDSDGRDEDRDSSRRARGQTSRELEDVKTDLVAFVSEHPVGTLAAALGVGYALGGGIFTRLTSGLLRAGLRLGIQFAVMPVIEQELAALVGGGGATNGSGSEPETSGGDTTHH
jgi:hypothetical protein